MKRLVLLLTAFLFLSSPLMACTIFCFRHDGKTYFCNNEDWKDPATHIRFFPATRDHYAWVYLGFSGNWAQGGVNEHGLCFDWVACGGPFGWKADPDKENYRGNLSEELLRTCKNVDEAIAFYKRYNEKHLDYSRTLIADKSGKSLLIQCQDGKLTMEIGEGPLHSYGVGKSAVDGGEKRLGEDFKIANLVQSLSDASLDSKTGTKYSNIMDLSEGKLILFQNRDYSRFVEIDYVNKLKQEATYYSIVELFDPKNEQPFVSLKEMSNPIIAKQETLPSDTNPISYQIEGEPAGPWTIMPELAPDTLRVECAEGEQKEVIFKSDVSSRTFVVSRESQPIRFDVALKDGRRALTEIAAVAPKKVFVGDYSPGREMSNWKTDLDPVLETYFPNDQPGASVAIWNAGELVYERSIGLADTETKLPRSLEQPFHIASVSKEFAAFAILKLAEEGKLKVEDPIDTFISGIPNGDKITIHHLLTHTSGIASHFEVDNYDLNVRLDVEKALDAIRSGKPLFEPGEEYRYGGTGYYLLSKVVEKVSEMDYRSYVNENLLQPAGMSDTKFAIDMPNLDLIAKGYSESDGEFKIDNPQLHPSQLQGLADVVSTLSDLRKWHVALKNGTIISPETYVLATTPKQLNDGTPIHRSYGFMLGKINGQQVVYNSGDLGTHTRYLYSSIRDISIIVNSGVHHRDDPGLNGRVRNQLAGKLLNSQLVKIWGMEIDLNKHP